VALGARKDSDFSAAVWLIGLDGWHDARLGSGGSATLSVTGRCRIRGGDGTSMVPRFPGSLVNTAHFPKTLARMSEPVACQCVGSGTGLSLMGRPSFCPLALWLPSQFEKEPLDRSRENSGKWSKLTSVNGRKCAALTTGLAANLRIPDETVPASPCAGAVSLAGKKPPRAGLNVTSSGRQCGLGGISAATTSSSFAIIWTSK
jgi:hypothetical protein